MRPVLLALVVFLPSVASIAATPCPTAPATGVVNSNEAGMAATFTKVLTENPGCTKTITNFCALTTKDLATLKSQALQAAIQDEDCAVNGVNSARKSLSDSDKLWYTGRAAFWNALYLDMAQNAVTVAAGTYQISPSMQAQFLGIEPMAAPNQVSVAQKDAAPPVVAPVSPPEPPTVPAETATAVAPTPPNSHTQPKQGGLTRPTPPASPKEAVNGSPVDPNTADNKTLTAPPAPTITSVVANGAFGIVNGVAQNSKDYKISKVFVCVLPEQPKSSDPAPSSCSGAANSQQATLLNFPSGGNYAVPSATDGTFMAVLSTKLTPLQYVYLTVQSDPIASDILSVGVVVPNSYTKTAPLGAAMAGLDISGASSTDYRAVFLGTGIMDLPLYSGDDFSKAKWWLNGFARIAGMAQPGTLTGALGSTASAASYLATAVNANPDNIVQSIEASGTVAYQFRHWSPSADTFDVGSYQTAHLSSPVTLLTLSAILSFGAITPLSASQANPPVYNLTNQILVDNPNINFPSSCISSPGVISSTPCYVSFVPSDRSHFYRNYEVGLRLKLYAGDYKDNRYRFPGMADLTFGQNEYVTGGHLRNFVLHIGGVMPVPHLDGVYIFGSMDTELNKNTGGGPQLILTPATSTSTATPLTFSSPAVTDISVSQPNRDRYRIGFGIDIFHLISSYVKPAATTASTSTSSTASAKAN